MTQESEARIDENLDDELQEEFLEEDEDGWDTEELEIEEEIEAKPRSPFALDSEEKVRLMGVAADAVRATDIVVLDLRGLTIIADFFLICTGKSSIQLRAIADRIEEKLRDQGERKIRSQGYQEATWILMDYGDVVVHIMAAEQRDFYNLEGFWAEAPQIELDLVAEPTSLGSGL